MALRAELLKEKAELESRLARITAALEDRSVKSARVAASVPARRGRRKRARNKLSLRELALQVTRAKPLTRRETLVAVERLGYKFSTKNPLNSLGVALYNKKFFKNRGGKFSPVK